MQRSSEAYTLIEVMAALSILMIIILFLAAFEMRYFKQTYVSNKTKEYTILIDALEKEIRNNLPNELRIGTKYISDENCNIDWVRNNFILSLNSSMPLGEIYCEINFLSGKEGMITIYDKNLRNGNIQKKIYFY